MKANFGWGAVLLLGVMCGTAPFGQGCSSNGGGGNFANPSGDDAATDAAAGQDSSFLQFGDSSSLQLESGPSGMGTGVCKNGFYSGTFMCTFIFNPDAGSDGGLASVAADAGGLMVTGTISFQLTQAMGNGESFMSTASGSFSGTALTFFTIMANVGGNLDCNSGAFNGTLTNGTYSGFLFLNGTFSGPLTAGYNGTTFSFYDGKWTLTVPGQGVCPGTWTASYAEN